MPRVAMSTTRAQGTLGDELAEPRHRTPDRSGRARAPAPRRGRGRSVGDGYPPARRRAGSRPRRAPHPGDPSAALGRARPAPRRVLDHRDHPDRRCRRGGDLVVADAARHRPCHEDRPSPHPRHRDPHRRHPRRLPHRAHEARRPPAPVTVECRDRPTSATSSAAPAARRCGRRVEDSILVIGPPRSGKGAHIVINAILDAPGAVVTTSTRPDNLTTTLRARRRRGPVAVFDPQQLAAGRTGGPAVVADPRLRGPTHRDDSRRRTRSRYRPRRASGWRTAASGRARPAPPFSRSCTPRRSTAAHPLSSFAGRSTRPRPRTPSRSSLATLPPRPDGPSRSRR